MINELLEKHEHYSSLFVFYEPLFTEKQIEYFKEYYFYDLSLAEIAENHNVSRAAIFDTINKMHNTLDDYENKLGLKKKYDDLLDLCDKYEELAKKDNDKLVLDLIEKIKESE